MTHRPAFRRTALATLVGLALSLLAAPAPSASASATGQAHANQAHASQTYAGYLFAYFLGEGTPTGERVHLATSRGNDPLRYDTLNNGVPVLTSTTGTTGARDPFLMRKRDGGFLLITTDAKMHDGPSWDHAQRHGSRNIVIWESPDLVTWSSPRLAEVGDDTVGNVWAPEAFYDPATRRYVVFWASNLYPRTDPQHTGPSYNRVLYATTTDFRAFSPQRVWIDPGHAVIDTTVVTDRGQFFRFTKDEREQSQAPCGKFVFQERGRSFFGPYGKVADCLGRGDIAMGEGATLFQDNNSGRWHMFVDEFLGRGYVPFETDDLASGRWTPSASADLPTGSRHGSVLPVTADELRRVRAAHPNG